jgi:hypothetical protein
MFHSSSYEPVLTAMSLIKIKMSSPRVADYKLDEITSPQNKEHILKDVAAVKSLNEEELSDHLKGTITREFSRS